LSPPVFEFQLVLVVAPRKERVMGIGTQKKEGRMNPTLPEISRPEACYRPLDNARIGELAMVRKGNRRIAQGSRGITPHDQKRVISICGMIL
jgi:hypothetical protein